VRDGDWGAVAALEADVYGPLGLSEGRAALESLGRVSPGTCFVFDLFDGPDVGGPDLGGTSLGGPGPDGTHPDGPDLGRTDLRGPGPGGRARPALAGYLLALPYPEGDAPALGRAEREAHRSGNLHLHDMVIAPQVRGRGLGGRLLGHLAAVARAGGYERLSLVAVDGSETFWAARGFTAHPGRAPHDGYGPDPVYMSLPLRAPAPPPGDPAPRRYPTPTRWAGAQ